MVLYQTIHKQAARFSRWHASSTSNREMHQQHGIKQFYLFNLLFSLQFSDTGST